MQIYAHHPTHIIHLSDPRLQGTILSSIQQVNIVMGVGLCGIATMSSGRLFLVLARECLWYLKVLRFDEIRV